MRTPGTQAHQTRTTGTRDGDERWSGRPLLAAALRTAILLVPPAVAVAAAVAVQTWLPPDTGLAVVLLVVGVVCIVVAGVVDRLARRLLPLESLLRMTMLFPGRAPSRLAVARLGRSRAEIERRLLRPSGAGDVAHAMLAMVTALGRHDRRTRGHSERVRMITELVADELTLTREDRDRLRWAALLHDIGKLDIPAAMLSKAGPLDDTEWTTMRQHPAHGARLAGPFLEWLGEWGGGIAHHHERYDGTGYPYGLAGDQISRAGRIVCVVDAFETMTAARSYKKADRTGHALAELTRCAGTQFDPAVVRAFLQVSVPKLWWATGALGLLVQVPVIGSAHATTSNVTAGVTSAAGTSAAAAGTAAVLGVGLVVVGPSPAAPATSVTAQQEAPADTVASPAGSAPQASAPRAAPAATPQVTGGTSPEEPVTLPAPAPVAETVADVALVAVADPAVEAAVVEPVASPVPDAADEPVVTEPVVTEPVATEPVATEPVVADEPELAPRTAPIVPPDVPTPVVVPENPAPLTPPPADPVVSPPVEKPVAPPVEEPVAPPVEEPVAPPVVEEPVAPPVEEPVDEPVEEPVDQPVDEPVDEEPVAPPFDPPGAPPFDPPGDDKPDKPDKDDDEAEDD